MNLIICQDRLLALRANRYKNNKRLIEALMQILMNRSSTPNLLHAANSSQPAPQNQSKTGGTTSVSSDSRRPRLPASIRQAEPALAQIHGADGAAPSRRDDLRVVRATALTEQRPPCRPIFAGPACPIHPTGRVCAREFTAPTEHCHKSLQKLNSCVDNQIGDSNFDL